MHHTVSVYFSSQRYFQLDGQVQSPKTMTIAMSNHFCGSIRPSALSPLYDPVMGIGFDGTIS